jgi:hypothetical protein
MTQYSSMKQTITIPSASLSPPPPPLSPPAPPLPLNMDVSMLATISEIDNLPPPPTDFIEQSPPPPMPSNISPAPPLPNSSIQSFVMRSSTVSTPPTAKTNSDSNTLSSSQRDVVSVTSETSTQDERPYIMRDLHSNLFLKKSKKVNPLFSLLFYASFLFRYSIE